MKTGAVVAIAIAIFIGLIALAFLFEVGGLQWESYFSPKHEAVRRDVFKETRSYNEGKEQELVRYRLQYLRETDEIAKKALASTIRISFADYNEKLLESEELRMFLKKIKYGE